MVRHYQSGPFLMMLDHIFLQLHGAKESIHVGEVKNGEIVYDENEVLPDAREFVASFAAEAQKYGTKVEKIKKEGEK
jgi:hypothetical protein